MSSGPETSPAILGGGAENPEVRCFVGREPIHRAVGAPGRRHRVDLLSHSGCRPQDIPRRYVDHLRTNGVRVLPDCWRAFSAALARARYDAVIFEFYHAAEGWIDEFRRCQTGALVIVDSVDVHFETRTGRCGAWCRRREMRRRRSEAKNWRSTDPPTP